MQALSALVALGAAGKTTICINIACHVAAGKNWNGHPVTQRRVIVFCIEENKAELDGKMSACISNWSDQERCAVIDGLRLVSCLDGDYRLTTIDRSQYSGTSIAESMAASVLEFGAELVIIDHLQGFVSGDLNCSETATAMAREANKIVAASGAAVVLTAHISKANIGAQSVEQGFAVGSLALENALRQMVGVITMPESDAKTYGVEESRSDYLLLSIAKNSYGPRDARVFLRRAHQPKYHTITIEPVQLAIPVSAPRKSSNEALCEKVINYIALHPRTTRNQLDNASGADGFFKASKERVRTATKALLDEGRITLQDVTPEERTKYNLSKQAKQVFGVTK